MGYPVTQAKEEKTTTPPEGGQKTTAGMLREMIRQEITSISDTLFKGKEQPPTTGTTETPAGGEQQRAADVKGEVARALQSLRAKEDRDARDAKVDELLAAHEAAKKTPEKPPVEQRRVHKIMGWGE